MTTTSPLEPTNRGRHFGNRKRRTGLKIIAVFLSLIIVAGIIGAYFLFHLQHNISTTPLNSGVGVPSTAPTAADTAADPMNILIIGTDTRKGNSQYGTEADSGGFGSSDVMMLLHLSADLQHATVLSLPRDLMAAIPSCKIEGTTSTSPAVDYAQINSALKMAGPGCTVATVSQLTGLTIDHMMLADFNAVNELSNAIGGVDVCVTSPVDDPNSGLKLPAGVSQVQGTQALAFLRTRESFGDGGDIGRIRAQQSFLSSLARKITKDNTLADVPKLYSIADTITRNLTVDSGLGNISELMTLANRLRQVKPENIEFITLPTEPWTQDPNRLQLAAEPAAKIFTAIKNDVPVSQSTPAPSPSQTTPTPSVTGLSPSPTTAPTATTDPTSADPEAAYVQVSLTNSSGVAGRETEVQKVLTSLGYPAASSLRSEATLPTTEIFYTYGEKDHADKLAASLGVQDAQVQYSDKTTGINLVIGQDFTTGSKITAVQQGLSGDLQGQTANQVTCQSVR
jgi:LCP family protein required for cell wall assembly